MAKRPIHRARVTFSISKIKTIRRKWERHTCIVFTTTNDLNELNKDDYFRGKLFKSKNKKKSDYDIKVESVEYIQQFGFTTDRF